MIEHEPIAKGRLGSSGVSGNRASIARHAGSFRAQHRVEVAAHNAVPRRQRLQQRLGLTSARAIAEQSL